MPVHKYRSVEEMPPPPCCERGSPAHVRRLAALWSRATRLAPRRMKSGLYRYRSVADAERARQSEGVAPDRSPRPDSSSSSQRLRQSPPP